MFLTNLAGSASQTARQELNESCQSCQIKCLNIHPQTTRREFHLSRLQAS